MHGDQTTRLIPSFIIPYLHHYTEKQIRLQPLFLKTDQLPPSMTTLGEQCVLFGPRAYTFGKNAAQDTENNVAGDGGEEAVEK
jgi:hypothetical protein